MEGQPQDEQQPTEEELRARIEEQLRKVRVQDLLVDSVASIVNLTARRIAKEDERDLEQARVGIEAARALVDLLEGDVAEQVRNALSELQLIYARASKGEPLAQPDAAPDPAEQADPPPGAPGAAPPPRPGPEPPPKLWTPGRD